MTGLKFTTALVLVFLSQLAVAGKDPTEIIPEPGIVPLLAVGAVVGIFLHWRSSRKK